MPNSPEIMEETDDRTQENEVEAQKLREEEDDEFGLDEEAEADREDNEEEENPAGEDQTAVESGPNRKKRKKDMNDRRPGDLILPFSRVQRVIKADKVRYSPVLD